MQEFWMEYLLFNLKYKLKWSWFFKTGYSISVYRSKWIKNKIQTVYNIGENSALFSSEMSSDF